MNYAEFVQQLERLNDGDVYVSPDFQCDRTGGYPTSLCVNWDKCKAWLQLNDSIDTDSVDVAEYEQSLPLYESKTDGCHPRAWLLQSQLQR